MVWRDHGHRHTLSSKFSVDSNGISSLSPISEDYASCMLSMICWELLGLGWSNLHWLVLLDPPKRSIGRYDQHQSSRLHNSLANARKGFTFQWHWQRPCTGFMTIFLFNAWAKQQYVFGMPFHDHGSIDLTENTVWQGPLSERQCQSHAIPETTKKEW